MAENENIVVDQTPPGNQPVDNKAKAVLKKIGAGLKEWGRKQIVILKRAPHRIPLLIVTVCSILWLIWLFTFSQSADAMSYISTLGLQIFVTTLISILVLPLFLNAFPKRKKANKVFIVMVFIFLAALIALDIVYYVQVYNFLYVDALQSSDWIAERPYLGSSLTLSIVHAVLVVLAALSLALMPVYAPLIKKINTAKAIEDNNIHETIEVEDE